MMETCRNVMNERDTSLACETISCFPRPWSRMEIRRIKFVAKDDEKKRQKLEVIAESFSRGSRYEAKNTAPDGVTPIGKVEKSDATASSISSQRENLSVSMMRQLPSTQVTQVVNKKHPRFGVASVRGRRRNMEDAVAVHTSFSPLDNETKPDQLHFFGLYDGHGCSHVATKCRERLHEIVKEELERKESDSREWKSVMERSFRRMDKEVIPRNCNVMFGSNCKCELHSPECDAVGSTVVVAIVTRQKIIVANCGDSRAVLCRNGKPVPLSFDHKPDRPDELDRINSAGGRVIYWDGPRVLGVLATSRSIGDNYLKPYVSCEPEITITDRTAEDECLVIGSDGLWDVVSNDTACEVAHVCLQCKAEAPACYRTKSVIAKTADKACTEATALLTKLALARESADNVSVVVVDLRRDA